MELDARSRTEGPAVWNGVYELGYQQVLRDLARAFGPTVYDVGANVGLVAIPLARQLGADGSVCCFEPVETNCARLRRNIALNGLTNCSVFETALGDVAGSALIGRESRFGESTGNAVLLTGDVAGAGTSVSSIAVSRLDDLVTESRSPDPDVIKLDVEGSEVAFLRGAQDVLRRARPVILGEFNSELMPTFGTDFLDAAALLPPDYAIFGFTQDRVLVEKEPYVGLGDVLLVPRERVVELPLTIGG